MNLMEDILSTYSWKSTFIITEKLNVSGHMLIWTFFLVLICGTRAQNLSSLFGYTLHIGPVIRTVMIMLCVFQVFFLTSWPKHKNMRTFGVSIGTCRV
jgi:hypothetical protein